LGDVTIKSLSGNIGIATISKLELTPSSSFFSFLIIVTLLGLTVTGQLSIDCSLIINSNGNRSYDNNVKYSSDGKIVYVASNLLMNYKELR
jgi:hypothetical protein